MLNWLDDIKKYSLIIKPLTHLSDFLNIYFESLKDTHELIVNPFIMFS